MKKIVLIIVILIFPLYYCVHVNKQIAVYEVKSGTNITLIAKDLVQKKIINSKNALIILAKIYNTEPKTGYYKIDNLHQFLIDIDSNNVLTTNITLIPGKTISEYYKMLRQHKFISTTRTIEKIMNELNIAKPYEGKFLAETYTINYGDSAKSIFNRSYSLMQKTLNNLWQKRYDNKYIKNKYQLITLASIIEKETSNSREKRKIAGVFINRLKKNMRLQSDPTVLYALYKNYNTTVLNKKDLAINSPYNTYYIKGLPKSAISSVTKETLLAAAQPEKHDLHYFVAKNNKEHAFAKTYAEHKQNIKKFLK